MSVEISSDNIEIKNKTVCSHQLPCFQLLTPYVIKGKGTLEKASVSDGCWYESGATLKYEIYIQRLTSFSLAVKESEVLGNILSIKDVWSHLFCVLSKTQKLWRAILFGKAERQRYGVMWHLRAPSLRNPQQLRWGQAEAGTQNMDASKPSALAITTVCKLVH